MSQSADAARKYAEYETKVGNASSRSWYIAESESGGPVKVICFVRRIPSLKQFWMYPLSGITEQELREANEWLESMPKGGWAKTNLWHRGGNTGRRHTFIHAFGIRVDDPLESLELEMMANDSHPRAVMGEASADIGNDS